MPIEQKQKPRKHRPLGDQVRAELQAMWRSMTKERLIDFLKTMVWVVPLTVLIWVYAEQEEERPVNNITAVIEVRDQNPNDILYLVSPSPEEGNPQVGTITVNISGSQNSVDRVERRLQDVSAPVVLELPSRPPQEQPYSWDTRTYVAANPIFASVDVTECSPATLQVRVDQLVSLDIPVKAPGNVPGLASALPTPDMVKILGPEQLLSPLEGTARWAATMDLAGNPLLNQPGKHADVTVRLLPPVNSDQVKLAPDTVTATLVVGKAGVTEEVTDIPVWVVGSPDVLNSFSSITAKNAVLEQQQTFIGPKDKLEALKVQSPKAVVVLTEDDEGRTSVTKPVSFPFLPEGVQYVPPPGGPPTVQLTLTPR